MLLLPKPKRLLLGYLLGAYTTSIALGLAIEHWLSNSGTVSTAKHTVNPIIDFTLGGLLLVVAYVVNSGRLAERRSRKQVKGPKKTPRWQRTLAKGSARDTFVVGLVLTLPGASYLAALDQIHKQALSAPEILLTVVAVNVIMLALLELPLIGYALAPEWTPAAVERLKGWLGANGGRAAVIGASVIGALLIARGVITLAN
jgi:Sap-like sulfolipid-1-addressing protein